MSVTLFDMIISVIVKLKQSVFKVKKPGGLQPAFLGIKSTQGRREEEFMYVELW